MEEKYAGRGESQSTAFERCKSTVQLHWQTGRKRCYRRGEDRPLDGLQSAREVAGRLRTRAEVPYLTLI